MSLELIEHLSECPTCRTITCKTIESRKTKDARRRRKECITCGTRVTTYEVSSEFYSEAITNKTLIEKVINLFGVSKVKTKTCGECSYMVSSECSFGFPEAGGDFAEECSMFSSIKEER